MAQSSESLTKKFPFLCKSMGVSLSLDEIRPYLSEEEYSRLFSIKSKSMALEKAHAYYLIKKLIGGNPKDISVRYSANGRPYINSKGVDISISHKEGAVYVGMAPSPYKIGVDIELINQLIDVNMLKNHFLNAEEASFLKEYSIRSK